MMTDQLISLINCTMAGVDLSSLSTLTYVYLHSFNELWLPNWHGYAEGWNTAQGKESSIIIC